MSAAGILDQLRSLPRAERRIVIGQIWEEFAETDLELTAEQAAELDRRAADYARRRDDVVPWEAVRAETRSKYGRRP